MKRYLPRIFGVLLLIYYGCRIWDARDYFSSPERLRVTAVVTVLVLIAGAVVGAMVSATAKYRQRTGSGGIYIYGLAFGVAALLVVFALMMRE